MLSFERALPRERPLAPVLKPALRQRLFDRWQSLQEVQASEPTLHTHDAAEAA